MYNAAKSAIHRAITGTRKIAVRIADGTLKMLAGLMLTLWLIVFPLIGAGALLCVSF